MRAAHARTTLPNGAPRHGLVCAAVVLAAALNSVFLSPQFRRVRTHLVSPTGKMPMNSRKLSEVDVLRRTKGKAEEESVAYRENFYQWPT